MPSRKYVGETFVISCKAAKPAEPTERPFDHPPARQQHKALLRFCVLHDFQLNTVIARLLGCIFTPTEYRDRSLVGLHLHPYSLDPQMPSPPCRPLPLGFWRPTPQPGLVLVHWRPSPSARADFPAYPPPYALWSRSFSWRHRIPRVRRSRVSIAACDHPKTLPSVAHHDRRPTANRCANR